MKIGLYNLEPNIVNTAMMQVSTYYKNLNYNVEIYNHLFKDSYNKIYAFSIFDFTDKGYITSNMICGGTGFNIKSRLPKEIESCNYDWSLYPNCDFSIIWFSRGCFRDCPFCIVREKEGFIYPVKPKNLNPNGTWIRVQDNNFFGNPKWKEAINQLKIWNQPVLFEGVDIRILNQKHAEALNSLKHKGQIGFAWDNAKDNLIPYFLKVLQWIKSYKIKCYVLIGFDSTEDQDLYRIEELRKLNIDPFVMPFNKKDTYQNAFARYVNDKAIFNSCTWKEYKKNPNKKNKDIIKWNRKIELQ